MSGLFYQWYKNNNPIAGATKSRLYLSEVASTDSGAQIVAKVRALGYGDDADNAAWSNSNSYRWGRKHVLPGFHSIS